MSNRDRVLILRKLVYGLLGICLGLLLCLIYVTYQLLYTPAQQQVIQRQSYSSEQTEKLLNLGEFEITAYCSCPVCCSVWSDQHPDRLGTDYVRTTYSGTIPKANHTIAVDPDVIPLGTQVKIGDHWFTAEDIGGAIKGNHIDIYFDNHSDALAWGVQTKNVFIKGE